jgi:ketopantoate reductase
VTNDQGSNTELVLIAGAADRAGSIVTEQIRSLMESAVSNADQVRHNAEQDAEILRKEAAESAMRVLEQLDAIKTPLTDLVTGLRREADALDGDVGRRGDQ